ncbi:MAG: alpha/beta hydrolase [Phycisphaerae bacterium]
MPAEVMRESVLVPGASGALAGELVYPFDSTKFATVLVNPHPHMGGHAGNMLLVRISDALAGDGGVVLSFDYSGVGRSEGPRVDIAESMSQFWKTGVAPEEPRMVSDVRCAVTWLVETTSLPIILAGYSFGAYAATLALTERVVGLLLISPIIARYDFSGLEKCLLPKMIVHGDEDFAAPETQLDTWISRLPPPVEARCITGEDHFFRGREDEVAQVCRAFVRKVVWDKGDSTGAGR